MILDTGICTIFHKTNVAPPGGKPTFENVPFYCAWYGELSFETSPQRPTEAREEVRTDARIRVLQNRNITNHDRVELRDLQGTVTAYEVTRAYHGFDADSGEQISDLSLEVVKP